MALVYFLYLRLAFVYFLYMTFFSLKIKTCQWKTWSTTKKTPYALEKIYNKRVTVIVRKIMRMKQSMTTATSDKELNTLGDNHLITTVTSMATAIFFGLRALGIGQQGALLTSTSLVSFMFLPAAFWSDDTKTLYNKWVVLIGKKTSKTLSNIDWSKPLGPLEYFLG